MIDLLMFLIIKTKPDLAFFITIAACFAKNLNYVFTKIITTIFYYFKKLIN